VPDVHKTASVIFWDKFSQLRKNINTFVSGKGKELIMENIYANNKTISVKRKRACAVTSLVLGILGLICFLFPVIGLPLSLAGFIFGLPGVKSTRQGMALTGITLAIAGIFLNTIVINTGIFIFREIYTRLYP
jgi:hypothetical protein